MAPGFPSVDLESWTTKYKGYTLLLRLLHVANSSEALAPQAIMLAMKQIISEQSFQSEMYTTFTSLANTWNVHIDTPLDENEVKEREKVLLKQLNAELTQAKTNLDKDGIRMALIRLGSHFVACGDLESALKHFVRSRDHCTTTAHTVQMCMHVIEVCIHSKSFNQVANYASRAEQAIAGAKQGADVDIM